MTSPPPSIASPSRSSDSLFGDSDDEGESNPVSDSQVRLSPPPARTLNPIPDSRVVRNRYPLCLPGPSLLHAMGSPFRPVSAQKPGLAAPQQRLSDPSAPTALKIPRIHNSTSPSVILPSISEATPGSGDPINEEAVDISGIEANESDSEGPAWYAEYDKKNEELFADFLPLNQSFPSEDQDSSLDSDDLVQAATVGLIRWLRYVF